MSIEVHEMTLSGDKAKVLLEMLKKASGEPSHKIAPDIMAIRLADHLAEFQKPNTFQPGQIVKLKPSFVATQCLGEGQLAIVMNMLQSPIFQTAASPSNEQGAWLDIRLLWVCPNHSEIHFGCFESALFEPWQPNG